MKLSRKYWGMPALRMAALACAAVGIETMPAAAAPALLLQGNRILMASGETPVQAISAARGRALAASLRAAWLSSGRSEADAARAVRPAITGGSVTANTVTVGDPSAYPELSFTFNAGEPGLSYAAFQFASPNGKTIYVAQYDEGGYARTGTASFASTVPLNLYSEPGTWSLASATVYDRAGNATTYDAHQLAKLFTAANFTVVNGGLVDDAPPRIHKGKLFNDTVSLSAKFPVLKATITASDAGSGLALAYIFFNPPGIPFSIADIAPLPLPLAHAAVVADNVFNSSYPTGTYGITGYAVCDEAGNCTGSMSDADVVTLLGTDTFTVTP